MSAKKKPTEADLLRELAGYKGIIAGACGVLGIMPFETTDEARKKAFADYLQTLRLKKQQNMENNDE